MSALRVRMYNVGFGDCFLLTFGTGADVRHVLFDCGSISSDAGQVGKVADHVIESCKGADGKARIALVVCTHRHRDHVGGFTNPGWKDVEVGEVWMPWTEDPEDAVATRIRIRQSGFAANLATALGATSEMLDSDPLTWRSRKRGLDTTPLALALNALTNEKAMQTLHSGFAGSPPRHFLPLKDKMCEARNLRGLRGVKFHILGPPRDEQALANMDPPKGGAYLKTAAAGGGATGPETYAFRPKWRANFWYQRPGTTFRADEREKINRLAEEPEGTFAAAIDRAVNNTSLIIMIEAGNQWLLFPGDAQWGAWNSALSNDQCRTLMKRTTFYKVGHHGSENATPKLVVEDIFGNDLVFFLSTSAVKQWPNVPRPPLVEAISKKGKLARSDNAALTRGTGFIVKSGLYTERTFDTAD